MIKVRYGNRFKRDFKNMIKRGHSVEKFTEVVGLLQRQIPLPPENCDHKLHGNYEGYRECHIEPDWLLIYRFIQNELVLVLSRTGSHSDLF